MYRDFYYGDLAETKLNTTYEILDPDINDKCRK